MANCLIFLQILWVQIMKKKKKKKSSWWVEFVFKSWEWKVKGILFFQTVSGCSAVEALEGATLHPAQVLGIEQRKGTLNYKSDADLVFLDEDLNVHATFIAGQPVWLHKEGLVTGVMKLNYNMMGSKSKRVSISGLSIHI